MATNKEKISKRVRHTTSGKTVTKETTNGSSVDPLQAEIDAQFASQRHIQRDVKERRSRSEIFTLVMSFLMVLLMLGGIIFGALQAFHLI